MAEGNRWNANGDAKRTISWFSSARDDHPISSCRTIGHCRCGRKVSASNWGRERLREKPCLHIGESSTASPAAVRLCGVVPGCLGKADEAICTVHRCDAPHMKGKIGRMRGRTKERHSLTWSRTRRTGGRAGERAGEGGRSAAEPSRWRRTGVFAGNGGVSRVARCTRR